jgi:methylenetetrahydrofolate dehydrogenase (NADP+)/methenyltetrahydrofolate cyclohydrolase
MILDGKALAARVGDEVAAATARFVAAHGVRPCLATVLVGEDPASHVYVRNKRRSCEKLGLLSEHHELPASAIQEEVLALLGRLNEAPDVHGILVQLPLPKHVDSQAVLRAISPAKDVDGFHPANVGLLALKQPRFVPCTPRGVMRLLAETGIPLSGRRATVLGRSAIVGLPTALLLTHADATVRIVHSRTPAADFEAAVREAELLVVAIGKARQIPGNWVREGSVVIDVGINRVTDGSGQSRLVGDVDYEEAARRAAWITPVPGGVGPMTIAMLMENTLEAARQQLSGAS